jgi:protein O-mannosyl-transferase
MPSRRGAWAVLCALLLLFVLWAFFPVLLNPFVNLDDDAYVAQNAQVQRGLTWDGVVWAFGRLHGAHTYWHPLTWISHMLDCQVFGLKPAGHHFVNLLLHVINTALVFVVFRQITGAPGRCLLLAALFALHPLQVDTVAWVAERKNLLAALFWLLTIWTYARYAQESKARSPTSGTQASAGPHHALRHTRPAPRPPLLARSYCLSLFLFALGLMCKPVLVTLPLVLLLLDYWPLRRFPPESGGRAGWVAGRLVWEKIPFLVLAAASSGITVAAHRALGMWEDAAAAAPLGFRLQNALVAYGRYIEKAIWPADLAIFYPLPNSWPMWLVGLWGLLLLAASGLALGCARNRPYGFVGWFWFVGVLVPFIGLVQAGQQAMADRFAYVPLIGLFVAFVWGAHDFLRGWRHGTVVLAAAGLGLVLLCTASTRRQLGYWTDNETLFRHAAAVTDSNALVLNCLGIAQERQGQTAAAIASYRQAISLQPKWFSPHCNLGTAFNGSERFAEAAKEFEEALILQPRLADAHKGLGFALYRMGRLDDAIRHYQEAIRLDPIAADTHSNLGAALDAVGRSDEAISQYQETVRLKPDYADAYNNLGVALARKGRFAEAVVQFRRTIELRTDDAGACANLGLALAEMGKPDEAAVAFRAALRMDPRNPQYHYQLGLLLVKTGRRDDAAGHFAEALKLQPDFPEAQHQLLSLTASPER